MEQKRAVASLAALAQATRLDIFRSLVAAGIDGLTAGEMAQRLNVPPPTLSFHLKDLATAGLVTSLREGRSIRYVADFDAMSALMSFLTENCCGSDPAACGLKIDACKPASTSKRKVKAVA
jgi:ArsR family transcriptional regulator, arsenate/arsenite/antimonite-responsive transcriptional repressor